MNRNLLVIIISFLFLNNTTSAQPRVAYNGQNLFMNGSNVAWVNFARDIGPGSTNFTKFREIFEEMKADGGNCFRLWLHTDGVVTPEFNSSGIVTGPGSGAAADLRQILDIAWENKISVMLCLWSHDMMRISLGSTITNRNQKLLTDTSAIRAYINNALIPMVEAVKGHPAILAWEIFNEPEGFTEIGNWEDRVKVRQYDVQRFVNMTAGAIHRSDSSVSVTNGTWGMQAQSDIFTAAKTSPQSFYKSLTTEEKEQIEQEFLAKYGITYSAEEIIGKFYGTAAQNTNYYRDDRLIAAGGDPDGTLDFYTVHYYSWAGTALSPFHHPYSYWQLTKPLVIAEFYMENAFGVSYTNLYRQLFNTGYAGALSWHWNGDTPVHDAAKNWNHERTSAAIKDIFENYPNEVVIDPVPGTIYTFKPDKDTIEYLDSVKLRWVTSPGSNPSLNGSAALSDTGSMSFAPDTSVIYTMTTNSTMQDTASAGVTVLFPGKILSFTVFPHEAAAGEMVTIKWRTTRNSSVKLNGVPAAEDDSIKVTVQQDTLFYLNAEGMVTDSAAVMVAVRSANDINRSIGRNTSASSGTSPASIADGNFTTEWSADVGTGTIWVQVGLEQYYSINKIVIKWGSLYAGNYTISNYKNPAQNRTVYRDPAGNGGIDTIALADTMLNVRLTLSQSSGSGYSIRELEIYGVPVESTGVDDPFIAEDYFLSQNYPNPFNPSAGIIYHLPEGGHVTLKVFDILGNEIQTLVNGYTPAGKHEVIFDGSAFASGTYIYRLAVNGHMISKKMILLK